MKNNFENPKLPNMFVVQNVSTINQDASNITKSTGKKTKGRRTAESAAVLSRHRFGTFCSDLPPFFHNQYFFKMQNEKGHSTKSAETGSFTAAITATELRHVASRPSLTASLLAMPQSQLVEAYLTELECCQQAYYFILACGHEAAFKAYLYSKIQKGGASC